MFRKFKFLLFSPFLFFFINPVFAIDDLTTLCHAGRYDYCSQAPKCGEYPEWNAAWEQKSRELFDPTIFEYCQKMDCQGYVPLCCYEMVRTKDPNKCSGYDTLYCLPSQCNQVPRSYEEKNCAHGTIYYCQKDYHIDAHNVQPIPLSQRFPNDVLFYQINANFQQASSWVPSRYPDIWNLYLQWKNGGGNSVTPTTNQPISATNTPTPLPLQPTNPTNNQPNNPNFQPTVTPTPQKNPYIPPMQPPKGNPPPEIFNPPVYYPPPSSAATPTPYKYFFISPFENIQTIKNNLINGVKNLSMGIYKKIVYFTDNYLP